MIRLRIRISGGVGYKAMWMWVRDEMYLKWDRRRESGSHSDGCSIWTACGRQMSSFILWSAATKSSFWARRRRWSLPASPNLAWYIRWYTRLWVLIFLSLADLCRLMPWHLGSGVDGEEAAVDSKTVRRWPGGRLCCGSWGRWLDCPAACWRCWRWRCGSRSTGSGNWSAWWRRSGAAWAGNSCLLYPLLLVRWMMMMHDGDNSGRSTPSM